MSIDVPLSFVSYRDDNPDRGRWDQLWLQRMLAGEEGCPPGGYTFVETPWTPEDGLGRVVVFSAGVYGEHGEAVKTLDRLLSELRMLEWAVVFATSDECQTFPWYLATSWPERAKLWVQLPRFENVYPPGTRFFAEGSPASAKQIAVRAQPDWVKDIDMFFSGQMGHERRVQMWEALGPMRERADIKVIAQATGGFTQGMDVDEYLSHMTRAWIVPCPSGICSQSSFRFFEALEAQCIPLADELRPHSSSVRFWEMLGLSGCGLMVADWSMLTTWTGTLIGVLAPPTPIAVAIQAKWQQYKRRILMNIHKDVRVGLLASDHWPGALESPDDMITVIIPTSPVPSNPSLDIILETIGSVRERLPHAEILITCDGVRGEQRERSADYYEFVRRLCAWTNSQDNITPWVAQEHLHQAGLAKMILPEVTTPYLLYVEHDCPLIGDIPFGDILFTMMSDELAVMRLYHEAEIHPEHEMLMLNRLTKAVRPDREWGTVSYVQTIQWSQRPHIAHVPFYRDMIATYFSNDARTMIEDVMHGVVQACPLDGDGVPYPEGIRAQEAWKRFRLAVYAPEGNIKRSTHLDARGDDPKYPMKFAYPGHRPNGAPPEGLSE